MTATSSTREITDYLRGVGMLAVLATHYFGVYDHDFYDSYLSNYANAFMAIFFILAGYGAYHSFERRFSSGKPGSRIIASYLIDRALRIYPLYWLGLLATLLVSPEYLPIQEHGLKYAIAVAAALPVVTSPLWFVPAIIQCYIFAPLLYLLFRKLGLGRFVVLNLAVIAVLLLISHEYAFLVAKAESLSSIRMPNPAGYLHRGVFLGNVFLFSLGLLTPVLVKTHGHRMRSWTVFYISMFSLLILSFILRYDATVMHKDQLLLETGYFFSVFFFCCSTLVMKPAMPLRRPMTGLGKFSYSTYLFHDALLFQALLQIHLLQLWLPLSLAIVLALFPVLMWFCIFSEKGSGFLRDRIWASGARLFSTETARDTAS